MIKYLKKIHWILSAQFGIDPFRTIYSLRGLPRYISDFIRFKKSYKGEIGIMPCLHDRYEEGGSTKNEYFWQDLLVARMIHKKNPKKHVDVGSRVDGFVAHVASFREIEVFDVRDITTKVPGILFQKADLMISIDNFGNYCDSLSCLHALEHFGLGRYGDPIDAEGYVKGIRNMTRILKKKGTFYLSIPIGIERVEFNANRVFDPGKLIALARENGLVLQSLTVIQNGFNIKNIELNEEALNELSIQSYSLGIFVFKKIQ
ncbi:MAG: DUF268 domain-containing protein [Gammaproteobacteria bacterium]|nr:DUF268 domain-containing protein [Gammaproteobacteria bacterium]